MNGYMYFILIVILPILLNINKLLVSKMESSCPYFKIHMELHNSAWLCIRNDYRLVPMIFSEAWHVLNNFGKLQQISQNDLEGEFISVNYTIFHNATFPNVNTFQHSLWSIICMEMCKCRFSLRVWATMFCSSSTSKSMVVTYISLRVENLPFLHV